MGGVGSGGYKNSPGDVETHSAWDLIDPIPGTPQKLRQARCKHCSKEMAQHTSRQRSHLLTCQPYLEAMKLQGIENSITRQATDPAGFIKPQRRAADQADGVEKRRPTQKIVDFSLALRLQALVLAEASISYDRIREITGIETKLLDKIRKIARDRGYDPTTSMQMKEEYVANPQSAAVAGNDQGKSTRKNSNKNEGLDGADGGVGSASQAVPEQTPTRATTTPTRPIPTTTYIQTDSTSIPPGAWNLIATNQ